MDIHNSKTCRQAPVPGRGGNPRRFPGAALLALLLSTLAGTACSQQPGVRYEPTPPDVVQVMLDLGDIRSGDTVYDLGCGDGRIVIEAVKQFNARGVCVDIDPQRIAESRENARAAGVADRIRFLNRDLFTVDTGEADVVMLFLSPDFNRRLQPKLRSELRAGARVVSHWHNMGNWEPEETVRIRSHGRERPIYLWTIPAR